MKLNIDKNTSTPIEHLERSQPFNSLIDELQSGLGLYWKTAGHILETCGVALMPPTEATFSFRKNFFSMLFLYSYQRAGILRARRILYAATLQCLRGMVTGCDNLLDDEYKPTLETDIPATGQRFRSVVDIMVSDRVLFQILLDAAMRQEIALEQVQAASAASMKTMTRSGIEEASEEAGITAILKPEVILQTIHHFKTGLLFQCPWDIPLTIETVAEKNLNPLLEGLYQIGVGCQILDDMLDMAEDIKGKKHNYVVSLVHHESSTVEKDQLQKAMGPNHDAFANAMLVSRFPEALKLALQTSRGLLMNGLGALFATEHQELIPSAIRFLETRIGVDHLSSGTAI